MEGVDVLVFTTEWCGPCKMYKPLLKSIQAEGTYNIRILDADKEEELRTKYNIRGVPTTIVLKNGVVAATSVGAMTRPNFINMVEGV